MNKKRFGFVSVVAVATLAISAAVVPTATAANKTITVWADEQRGPQLKSLIDGNTTIAPGYVIKVKFYASLDALTGAFDKATAAAGPDVMTGPAGLAASAGKSGKLAPLTYSAVNKKEIPAAGIQAMTYKGKTYGVPLDVDTTAFMWNKALNATAPTTFQGMVDYYTANKASKGLTGGICAFEGAWGANAVLTALGGGAWGYKGNTPDLTNTLFNSAAFKAGKIPFGITGAWNMDGIAAAGVNIGLGATPGLTATTKGAQWVNYSGAYVTSFAAKHGVDLGAKKLVLGWFASKEGQVLMSSASSRPPANTAAGAIIKDSRTTGIANAAKTGTPQFSAILDNKAGGSNWYDVVGSAFTNIFVKGESVDKTLDDAAVILKKNFADAAKN